MTDPSNENTNAAPLSDAEMQRMDRRMDRWNRFLNGVLFYFSGAKWYVLGGIAGLLFFVYGKAGGLRWLSYAGIVFLIPAGLFLGLYVLWMLFSQILAEITAIAGRRYDTLENQGINSKRHE